MDLNFIYCRLFDAKVNGVTALGLSDADEYLAACLSDGSVHIYDTYLWNKLLCLSGGSKNFIRGVFWLLKTNQNAKREDKKQRRLMHAYRLLTVGLNGCIDEWDLLSATLKRSVSSTGGAVFDMVISNDSKFCFAACDDGCVKVFRLNADDNSANALNNHKDNHNIISHNNYSNINDDTNEDILFYKSIAKHSSRLLSVCTYSSNTLFVGTSNSLIMKVDVRTGNAVAKMKCDACSSNSTNENNNEQNTEVQVWRLKCIEKRGVLISGDSTGSLCVWDANTNTLLKLFKQHLADILDINVGADKSKFYSVGVDCRISVYSYIHSANDWSVTMQAYPHSSDITAVLTTKDGRVVTGSLDTAVCVFGNYKDINGHERRRMRIHVELERLVTSNESISFCHSERLILLNYSSHLDVWYFMEKNNVTYSRNQITGDLRTEKQKERELKNSYLTKNVTPVKLATIKMSKSNFIKKAAVSPDGRIIALVTFKGLKLFLFDINELEVTPIACPAQVASAKMIYSLLFINNKSIALCAENKYIKSNDECCSHKSKKQKNKNEHEKDDITANSEARFSLVFLDILSSNIIAKFSHFFPIKKLNKSADGQWLAAFDIYSNVDVYALDFLQWHCSLPKINFGLISDAVFHPKKNLLAAFSPNFCFYIFDLNTNSVAHTHQRFFQIPKSYLNRNDGEIGKVLWIAQTRKDKHEEMMQGAENENCTAGRNHSDDWRSTKEMLIQNVPIENQHNDHVVCVNNNHGKYFKDEEESAGGGLRMRAEETEEINYTKHMHPNMNNGYEKSGSMLNVEEWVFVCYTYSKTCMVKLVVYDSGDSETNCGHLEPYNINTSCPQISHKLQALNEQDNEDKRRRVDVLKRKDEQAGFIYIPDLLFNMLKKKSKEQKQIEGHTNESSSNASCCESDVRQFKQTASRKDHVDNNKQEEKNNESYSENHKGDENENKQVNINQQLKEQTGESNENTPKELNEEQKKTIQKQANEEEENTKKRKFEEEEKLQRVRKELSTASSMESFFSANSVDFSSSCGDRANADCIDAYKTDGRNNDCIINQQQDNVHEALGNSATLNKCNYYNLNNNGNTVNVHVPSNLQSTHIPSFVLPAEGLYVHAVHYYGKRNVDFILFMEELPSCMWGFFSDYYMLKCPKRTFDRSTKIDNLDTNSNGENDAVDENTLSLSSPYRDIFTFVFSKALFLSKLPLTFNRKRYAT